MAQAACPRRGRCARNRRALVRQPHHRTVTVIMGLWRPEEVDSGSGSGRCGCARGCPPRGPRGTSRPGRWLPVRAPCAYSPLIVARPSAPPARAPHRRPGDRRTRRWTTRVVTCREAWAPAELDPTDRGRRVDGWSARATRRATITPAWSAEPALSGRSPPPLGQQHDLAAGVAFCQFAEGVANLIQPIRARDRYLDASVGDEPCDLRK